MRTAEEKRVRSSSLLQRVQMFHDAGVVNAQKLVGASHHVDVKRLSFGAFLIHEKEHRLVCMSVLEDDGHDLKQSLAQSGGAAFGDISGLRIEVAGLKGRSVNARKSDESFFIGEAGHVADFGNKLRSEDGANAV